MPSCVIWFNGNVPYLVFTCKLEFFFQMSSFATLYGFSNISGGTFRIGLSNNQYLSLSEIFPYFKKHGRNYVIEG